MGRTTPGNARLILGILVLGSGLTIFGAGLWSLRRGSNEGGTVETVTPSGVPTASELVAVAPPVAQRIRASLRAIRKEPNDAEAYGRLGMLYEGHWFMDLARECYARASALDPTNPRWRYLWATLTRDAGDSEGAEQALREVIATAPEYAPAHERLGLLLLERRAYPEAMMRFRRVIELRPDEAPGYVALGRALITVGRYEEAAEQLRKALAIAPTYGRAHYLLGRAYRRMGRLAEARAELALGADAKPRRIRDRWRMDVKMASTVGPKGRLALAEDLMKRGRPSEARRLLEQLLESNPDDIDVINSLGMAYLSLHRLSDVEQLLLRAIRDGRATYETHANLAAAYFESRDFERALSHAETATDLAPHKGWPALMRGEVLAFSGRLEEALIWYRRAAQLDIRNPATHARLGETLVRLGKLDEAVPPLRTAVRLKPQSARAWYYLATAQAHSGQLEEAARTLREALSHNPRSRELTDLLSRIEQGLAER